MPQLLKYRLSDGGIHAIMESNMVSLLTLQIPAVDEVYGYLIPDESIALAAQEHYEVLSGVVTAKTQCVITASPNPFLADGVATSTVTMEPFAPCTLTVNGNPVYLTTGAPNLTLTAAAPQSFTVVLPPRPGIWADPIVVTAASA